MWNFKKYVQILGRESSFHGVRLLGHNRTSKSVKVPIFPLALNATVVHYVTAQTTFKVLSFFGWLLTVWTNNIYTAHVVVTIVTINGVQKFEKQKQTCCKKTIGQFYARRVTYGMTLNVKVFLRQNMHLSLVTTTHGPAKTVHFSESYFEYDSEIEPSYEDIETHSPTPDTFDQLRTARNKFPNRFLCAYLNINSLRKKLTLSKTFWLKIWLIFYLLQKLN